MIEAKRLVAADEAMVAEEAAGCVANQGVGVGACGFDVFFLEHVAGAPEQRATARDADVAFGDLLPCV